MISMRVPAPMASASSRAACSMPFIRDGGIRRAASYSSSPAERMRRAAYTRARIGCMPDSRSVRRSRSENARSTNFMKDESRVVLERFGAAPEPAQVAADDLEARAALGHVQRHHADAARAQRGEQRREPVVLERFQVRAIFRLLGQREGRAQAVEDHEVP